MDEWIVTIKWFYRGGVKDGTIFDIELLIEAFD